LSQRIFYLLVEMSVLNCLTASSEIKSEPDEEFEEDECNADVDPLGPLSEFEVKLESDIGTEGPEKTNNEDSNEAIKVMCPNCNCTFNISLASLSLNVSGSKIGKSYCKSYWKVS